MIRGPAQNGQDAAVPYREPLWVRAIIETNRVGERIAKAIASVRNEALLAWIPLEHRGSFTAAAYADRQTYLPGGQCFENGLFSWEARILSSAAFPPSGRVLVGASGAGRELVALVERGYEVVAFDPCLPFVEAAQSLVPPSKAKVVHASYRELVEAAAGRGGGPLAPLCAGKRFDAAILGWGSLSHVMPASARLELLQAVRLLVPDGPVLASFVLHWKDARAEEGRVRTVLRRAFAAMGAPTRSDDHDHYDPNSGFCAYLTRDDLAKLAGGSGYEIALLEEEPYPHALLLPPSHKEAKRRVAGKDMNDAVAKDH